MNEPPHHYTIEDSTPIFLVGRPRSGTTLVQRLVNCRNDTCIWGEHNGFLNEVRNSYVSLQGKHPLGYSIKENNTEDFCHDIIDNPKNWIAWANCLNKEKLIDLYGKFLFEFFNPRGRKFWGFKEIRYDDDVLEFLIEIYRHAKFLLIYRNPEYCVRSQKYTLKQYESHSIEELATIWREAYLGYMEFYRRHASNCMPVCYDELIMPQSPMLGTLLRFLGMKHDDEARNVIDMPEGRHWESGHKPETVVLDDVDRRVIERLTGSTWHELDAALRASGNWRLRSEKLGVS